MNIISSAAIATVIMTVTSCGGSGVYTTSPVPPTGPGTPAATCTPGNGTVCLVSSNSFNPSQVTIAAGSSITFNNGSGTTHNVTFTTAGAPANVADFASGTRVVTFPTTGTYNYHCTIHGLSMSGVVVVQ
jgi:plastocyanin